MKKIIATLALLAVIVIGGCGAGTAQTSAEVRRSQRHALDVRGKQLNDDLNRMFHLDRPSRLSDKYVR